MKEEGREVLDDIKNMHSRMYRLSTPDILSLSYQLAAKNIISYPFSVNKEKLKPISLMDLGLPPHKHKLSISP